METHTFTHKDLDGDTLQVQQGVESAVFNAQSTTGEFVQVAVHPVQLRQLIDTLQAMLPELRS